MKKIDFPVGKKVRGYGLINEFGGGQVPGVGFGLGIERLLLLMENLNILPVDDGAPDVYIATLGQEEYKTAFLLAQQLRLNDIKTEIDHMGRSLKAQFKYADKIGAKYVYVIGADELAKGEANLKKMADGSVSAVKFDDLVGYLNSL